MRQAQHRKNRQSSPVYWKAKLLWMQEDKHDANLHLTPETEKHRLQRIQRNPIPNEGLHSEEAGKELQIYIYKTGNEQEYSNEEVIKQKGGDTFKVQHRLLKLYTMN